ncbi:WD40/YVTN/BNR-like repeat-containing protein [Clostridium sp. Marseille-QA1073]
MKNIMNITKKKAGASILCGALVLTLGTGKAFASNADDSIQVKNENGVITYSIDGGQTWSEDAPEGFTGFESEDGKIKIKNTKMSEGGIGIGVQVKLEDGVKLYSTDGGQTWSEDAPEGLTEFEDEDGKIKIKNANISEDGIGISVQVKLEDGVKLYSTDGGQTWSENAPEGIDVFDEEDGKIGIKNSGQIEGELFIGRQVKSEDGILSKGGNSFMVKNENGTRFYSEDGGQTWSEDLPEGMSIEIK